MLSSPDLRKYLRRQRLLLSASNRLHFNTLINQHLITSKLLIRCSSIASYLATDVEVNLLPFIKTCSIRRIHHLLPVIQKNHSLKFQRYNWNNQLNPNKYGIFEPTSSKTLQTKFISAIITPLVGFDALGNRLGMGGGYYDRSLTFSINSNCLLRPLIIGAAYQLQEVKSIPSNDWDVPLDAVVTEKGIIHFSKRAKYLL